jgi:S1-C subfamily serine protease
MVKEFLSQRGVAFEERDVSRNQSAAQEMVRVTGQMGVPVTVIDGQSVVGFDRRRLEQVLNHTSDRQRPSFGASIADASRITAKQGLGMTLGAYIGKVRPGSIAARAGLAAGDIITELNVRRIANADDLEDALSGLNRGNRFSVVFLRADKTLTTEGKI